MQFLFIVMFKFFFVIKKINYSLILPIQYKNRYSITQKISFWCLPIIYDNMNNLSYYKRNRIRFLLMPFLNYLFDCKLEKRILQFCTFKTKEEKYFQTLVNHLLIHHYEALPSSELTLLILPQLIEGKLMREVMKYSKNTFNNRQIIFIINNMFNIGKVNLNVK